MRLLLDTHVLIWALEDTGILRPDTRSQIANAANDVFISVVVLWEIAIKEGAGKLKVPRNIVEVIAANRFQVLPIHLEHVLALRALPAHHRDPFDRMLVAQAQVEGLTLITNDRDIHKYDVPILSA